ncbi:MAG: hypothetical protein P8Y09_08540 [Deltaproteobacteria bacterium]|jgi:hypothetical protein
MLQLLAAIPTIISAVSKVTELFRKGQKAKEKVSGTPSVASTPEELQEEISALPDEQKVRWVDIMQKEIDLYAQENQRLAIEIGLVDETITSKVSPEAASKIALMRQTTRPWAVRMMVHYVFFPFYLIIIDLVQQLIKTWFLFWTNIKVFKTFDYVFGATTPEDLKGIDPGVLDKLVGLFQNNAPRTLAGQMYIQSIPWVVGIIVAYMGLREYGKVKGTSGDVGLGPTTATPGAGPVGVFSKALEAGVDLVSKVKDVFGKGR